MLESIQVHPSWDELLTGEIREDLQNISQAIGTNYNPTDRRLILRFLQLDLMRIRVIWLGQDVYPAKGVATGRAFEVGHLTSWQQPFRQASLKNIVRNVYKVAHGFVIDEQPPLFSEIRTELQTGRFYLLDPKEWFDFLEYEGVLFLNTSFTCEIDRPDSHKKYWQSFSEAVLTYIARKRPDMIYFLWGKEAQSARKIIQEGIFYESRHPSRVSPSYPDDFLKFTGFEETKQLVNWFGPEYVPLLDKVVY